LLAYDDTTGTLWLTAAHDSNLRQLIAIAVNDQRVTSVHDDPQQLTDVFSVAMANKTPRIVQYQTGAVQNYGLDEAAQAMIEQIEAQVPTANLTLTLADDAVMSLVRQEASDLGEARYHLFNRDSGSFIEILASTRNPALPDVSALSRKMPFDYRASDGFLLHGYLTLPQGISIAQAPLVALIHGGPWGRVFSSYSGYTQLLANRGYIVFEPNFRASTGYGLDYMTAANRDFGNGVVQQDITDGVRHLLANGIGNSDRVAIAGASFGGFSVLAGLAFTPELYEVGIAAVPPADMSDSARRLTSRPGAQHQDPAASALLRALLVDMEDAADIQRLHAKSPQASLATITAPLLLLAGADDDRVSISHVKDYSLELLNLGKEVSLLIDEDEGHGFEGGQAMNAYYYLTELMLEHYLQGRLQPLDDPALAKYIERKLLLRAGPLQADHR
jgi:dipeptidyl aminopeptidase/acylaminoacyl peptidase